MNILFSQPLNREQTGRSLRRIGEGNSMIKFDYLKIVDAMVSIKIKLIV